VIVNVHAVRLSDDRKNTNLPRFYLQRHNTAERWFTVIRDRQVMACTARISTADR